MPNSPQIQCPVLCLVGRSLSAVPFLVDSAGIFTLCRKTPHIDYLPDARTDRRTDRQAAASELWVTFHSSWSKSPSVSACNCQAAAFLHLSDLETHVHLWQWEFILTDFSPWHSLTPLSSGHFTAYSRIMLYRCNVIYAQKHTCWYIYVKERVFHTQDVSTLIPSGLLCALYCFK